MADTTRHRVILAPPAALLILLLLRVAAHGAAPPYPVLAVDPLPAFAELENHAEAISRWRSRGFARMVLLHIDTRDRTRALGPDESASLAEMRAPATAGPAGPEPLTTPAKPFLFETSFVRAAFVAGIVRETYWIVPFDYFRRPDPAADLRADLRVAGFSDEDLRTFALRDGCFRGTVSGSPFAVCGLAELPRIADPILLNLGADFILSSAAASASNPFLETRKLIGALAARRYAVADAVLCASVETEYATRVTPDLRWVGEVAAQAFRDPALVSRPETSKRWSALQSLALLKDLGNYEGLFHDALPFLTIHDDDPALQLYVAAALAGLGRPKEALGHATQACRLHPGYCCGLPWLGLKYFEAGDLDGGELFFAAAARLRPHMAFGQGLRGITLLHAGRSPEALQVFLGLSEDGLAFPNSFLAGAILLRAGDRQSARRQFDRAFAALRNAPDAEVTDPDTAQAVREAARLYREEGLIQQAEQLENNPRLQLRPSPEPPESPQP